MSGDDAPFEGLQQAARIAWGALCPSADSFPAERVRRRLTGVVDTPELDRFLEAVATGDVMTTSDVGDAVTDGMSDGLRRAQGIYLTPARLADALAVPASRLAPGQICIDLSCGGGALLLAAARRNPEVRAVGVEGQLSLAIAAAARLEALRREQGLACRDRVVVGDGLAEHPALGEALGNTALALGNPPYVREKGNRERFQELRAKHAHLEEFWGARMDLQYLFFHRSLDYLARGGWMAFLTSSYWLTATNARALRRDLSRRATPRVMLDIRGRGVFADAPGHHTLLSYLRRGSSDGNVLSQVLDSAKELDAAEVERAVHEGEADSNWQCVGPESFVESHWSPFVDSRTRSWGERWVEHGVALGELLDDRQGFVSGADRVHAWNQKRLDEDIARDTPIFLFENEVPDGVGRSHGTVLRPVIRGSRLEANQVVITPPSDTFGLYIDGPVEGAALAAFEAHLGRFRGILAARREARTGAMPWYRLHWPRDRDEQTQPKLVVPRRAQQPAFALDLSGSCVSSDCTYLLAPDSARAPLRYLAVAMVLLNRPETERYLREFGKTKGELLEFYSEPLRRLPLPVRDVDGHLELNRALLGPERARSVEAAVERVLARFG
jgi:adenine-specific DNA-methyltransferase